MCRESSPAHNSPRLWLVILSLVTLCLPARADEVARWLERHDLDRLLAVHLEEQLTGLTAEERDALVLELVGIYAKLLESTDDPALLRELEERSRRLLAATTQNVGEELRLALLRGSYRGAERIAENHRLRQSTPEDLARAGEILSEIIPKLTRLGSQIDSRLKVTERRLMRTGGNEATVLAERAEDIQQLHTQCSFLTAWALYYQSWLNRRPDNARVAEERFARLLDAETARPQPPDISVDLRAIEAMARCILGMALCKSLTSSSATALAWIDLLSHPQTWEPLRDQVPAWKLVIHLEHEEFRAARTLLATAGGGPEGEGPPLAWIRLAAVHALEAEDRNREAAQLARLAVTRLAARGELKAVLDLAERYGVTALGDSGFAFRYVRGVQHYDRAREAHGGEQPVADPRQAALYDDAAGQFEAALAEDDADQYREAAASCRWLIGWCRFFQERFLDARAAFRLAAGSLGRDQAPEALWMAVVCLDRAVTDGHDELAGELAALIDEILVSYPVSPYTEKLKLRRALQRDPSAEVVEELLSISADSDVYGVAREQAARMLYTLFRDSTGDRRLSFGNEYLTVALPLLAAGRSRAAGEAVGAFVARSRQVLEVALADGIGRLTAAARVLEAIDELSQREDLSAHRDEFDCRRVQERLLAGDPAAAEAVGDELWARNPDSIWARLSQRALFGYGLARWKTDRGVVDPVFQELVLRHGRRVIAEYEDRPDALTQTRVLAYHAAVAEAHLIDWQRGGDPIQAAAALALYERLLTAAPGDARFLRATAILSEALDRVEQALQCWRTLVAGSPFTSDRWYEAKFHVISLLAETDPTRARAVMDQHKQLNPGYGPEPWASRLRQLDARIPAGAGQETGS